jgi:hypothetical protein
MLKMAENQIAPTAKPEFKTSLIKVQDQYLGMVEQQLAGHRVGMNEYQKTCAINTISAIAAVMDKTGVSFNHADVDQSSITQILLTVTALQLNASATPREVYFQVRNVKKIVRNTQTLNKNDDTVKYVKVVEMGIEGDGNDALLRRFGADIKKVGQYWLVREGDDFQAPKYIGMKVEPPVWVPKGSGRVIMVVYPILKNDGAEEYHIAHRDEVKPNLMAHISNNLMNETFGVCQDRYKASQAQLDKIAEKKREIIDRANAMSIDEILDEKSFEAWISPAWREPYSRDLMIIRKMRNNIVKKIPKDFGSGFAAGQYEQSSQDEEFGQVTRDIGGDVDPDSRQLMDINPELEPVKSEPIKTPKPRPQRTTPVQDAEPEVPQAADEDQKPINERFQIGF